MSGQGERVVALAQGWIGTPYRHQGALKGVGCDCIGLIRGIWRELYGEEPETVSAYAPDWAERSGEDRLMDAALRLFGSAMQMSEAEPGDVLLFRWRPECAAKHAGVLVGPQHFIHAYEQSAVTRSALVPSWRRRVAGVYRFPVKARGPQPNTLLHCENNY
ncbi:NlpC/P60 family protein [Neorhizobium galegae]|uniref:NlpC/P60 family protein n=1 Tax=Neorhizobium galegae TaxID=399 RepID=UPI0006222407|nr:NlpC/P60 family protein [Neorhizobium galegae]MCQ1764636.1 NlpC/P60 family protein [Neorhizobium galegae]MCQ1847750.1 NlpC/P60 family protein [Neorhizobium galegae]CDZ37513.1 Phage cell wall peptidase, NlpC/P60 family [Neorhizobium galegae bv. officinalis]